MSGPREILHGMTLTVLFLLSNSSFVQIFFREERLPIAEGWTRSETLITAEAMVPVERIIETTAMWTATQQCEPLVIGPTITL